MLSQCGSVFYFLIRECERVKIVNPRATTVWAVPDKLFECVWPFCGYFLLVSLFSTFNILTTCCSVSIVNFEQVNSSWNSKYYDNKFNYGCNEQSFYFWVWKYSILRNWIVGIFRILNSHEPILLIQPLTWRQLTYIYKYAQLFFNCQTIIFAISKHKSKK